MASSGCSRYTGNGSKAYDRSSSMARDIGWMSATRPWSPLALDVSVSTEVNLTRAVRFAGSANCW